MEDYHTAIPIVTSLIPLKPVNQTAEQINYSMKLYSRNKISF